MIKRECMVCKTVKDESEMFRPSLLVQLRSRSIWSCSKECSLKFFREPLKTLGESK